MSNEDGPFSGEVTTSRDEAVARLGEAMKACFWAGVDPADSCQEMHKRLEAEVLEEMKAEDAHQPKTEEE
jgi:hypothetical protein